MFVFVSVLYLYRWEFMPRFFPGSCAAVFFFQALPTDCAASRARGSLSPFFSPAACRFFPGRCAAIFSPEQSALCSLGFSPLTRNSTHYKSCHLQQVTVVNDRIFSSIHNNRIRLNHPRRIVRDIISQGRTDSARVAKN